MQPDPQKPESPFLKERSSPWFPQLLSQLFFRANSLPHPLPCFLEREHWAWGLLLLHSPTATSLSLSFQMKKTGFHFVAGCSQHCKTKGHPCTHKSTAACYQECCQAMPKTSCLKLDGKVHFNRASGLASASLLQLLAWAALLSLSCSVSFLAGIN